MDKSSLKCNRGNLYYRQRNRQTRLYCIFLVIFELSCGFSVMQQKKDPLSVCEVIYVQSCFFDTFSIGQWLLRCAKKVSLSSSYQTTTAQFPIDREKKSTLFHFENEKSLLLITWVQLRPLCCCNYEAPPS